MVLQQGEKVAGDLTALIDEAINLELNMSDLYLLFNKVFSEDRPFWWGLSLEEKNHAALIKSGKDYFLPTDKFPVTLIENCLESMKNMNAEIITLVEKFKNNVPSRQEAFNTAIKIENTAGELHFQRFMEKDSESKVDQIFLKLNKEDKDHAKRLGAYMDKKGIELNCEKNLSK